MGFEKFLKWHTLQNRHKWPNIRILFDGLFEWAENFSVPTHIIVVDDDDDDANGWSLSSRTKESQKHYLVSKQ